MRIDMLQYTQKGKMIIHNLQNYSMNLRIVNLNDVWLADTGNGLGNLSAWLFYLFGFEFSKFNLLILLSITNP